MHKQKLWGLLVSFGGALALAVAMIAISTPQTVRAQPPDLASAISKYPNIDTTAIDSCDLCHAGDPPNLNPYGQAYLDNGRNTAAFGLIESTDSDGDGFTNVQEIKNFLTFPGNSANYPSHFTDVPHTYWAVTYIERLYNAGITGGCTTVPLNYCPTNSVTRAQMAIFLLRGMHGSAYVPPAATGTKFTDVPLGTFGAAWIEQLANEGITSGCGGTNYCPTQTVSRAQMAIFLVRAKHGISFVPPTATGIFPDVPVGSFGANYIEQLVADAITTGCGGGNYCPNTMVKRDSMAVFLVKAFALP
jgi:hypothetical protein